MSQYFISDFSHISAQTIFSLLDCLTRWARLKADSSSKTVLLNTRSEKNEASGMFVNNKLRII
jgi:hypothetical protein